MAYRWFKTYIEILNDPKMARLPDRLWRRTLEMFAFAKSVGDNGNLPPFDEMAWVLHMDEQELEADLQALASLPKPIMRKQDDGSWFVINFAKRQAPESATERTEAARERDRTQPDRVTIRDSGVTVPSPDLDLDLDQDKIKIETRLSGAAAPCLAAPTLSPTVEKPVRKPKPPKELAPPAVTAFREVANRFPNKATWAGIAQVVGTDPPDLERWQAVIRSWIACGWNPLNVKGMLQFYVERRLPGDGNGHKRDGPPEPKSMPALRALAREQGWDLEEEAHV